MKQMNRILAFLLALTLVFSTFAGTIAVKVSATGEPSGTESPIDDQKEDANNVNTGANNKNVPSDDQKEDTSGSTDNKDDGADDKDDGADDKDDGADDKDDGADDKDDGADDKDDGADDKDDGADNEDDGADKKDDGKTVIKGVLRTQLKASSATTKVYFYNSDSWGDVYGYVYGDCGEVLGGWPGTAATSDGNGWWYVNVPASSFSIIFTNNSGVQTADATLSGTAYITVNGGVYGSKEAAEAAINPPQPQPVTTRVHFYNSSEWGSVYAHVYNSDAEVNTSWPGMAATSEGDGWWYVDVTAVDAEFTIIFNNNGGAQTADVNISGTAYVGMDGVACGSKAEVEAKYTPQPVTTRVYFYDSSEWGSVYAHVYNSDAEVNTSWPGMAATSEGDGWWYVDVTAVDAEFAIIFNNNSGAQTADVNISGTAYVGMDGVACGTKAEVEAKYVPQPVTSRVNFYNSSDWSAVNTHIYNTDANVNTDWPGIAATNEEGTKWWYVDVTAVDTEFTIIFNDGGSNQTTDVNISGTAYVGMDGVVCGSKEEVEAKYAPQPVTTRVYFYNSSDWSAVNAHVYNTDEDVNTAWPGMAVTNEEGTKWWYVDVTAVDAEFTIIFNNGSGAQTADVNISGTAYVGMDGVACGTKAEVEAKYVPQPVTTRVYFYNSSDWSNVYAHVYNTDEGVNTTWPGMVATSEGNGWWYVDVTAVDTEFTIVFNDGVGGDGKQTADINISDKFCVDMEDAYATKAEVEAKYAPQPVTIRVYFYNISDWSAVNAHVYNTDANVNTQWPGMAATNEEGTKWWYVDVTAVDAKFTIIFNDGVGGDGKQTADINISDKFCVDMEDAYATKAEVESKYAPQPVTTRVYFYNNQGWEAVAAHIYNETSTMFGDWPGKQLTAGSGNWYYLEVDAATLSQYYTIIFNNNNNGAQLAGVDVPTEAAPYFAGGSWYATKEAAEEAVKTPEEKPRTTVWFYNSDKWAAVNAYVYNTNPAEVLGAWPGAAATRDGETDWWYVDVPAAPEFTIIFNDGGSNQTGSVNINENVYVGMDGKAYANRTSAEVANPKQEVIPAEKITIWFYDAAGWGEANAHIYGDAGVLYGEWPGKAMTSAGENWYTLEVDSETCDKYQTLIFNGNGAQLAGTDTPSSTAYFVDGTWYTDKGAADEAVSNLGGGTGDDDGAGDEGGTESGTTMVWFYNSNGWATVNAYVYGASNGEALGTWPGMAATRDGSTNWWLVEVPADPQFTIIFNDGEGAQSKDVLIADKNNIYVTVSGTTPFATKTAAEEAMSDSETPENPGDSEGSTTVWFYNSDTWADVYAYAYNTNPTEALGGWPGTAATRDGETDWWSVEVPADPEFVIIFNNGKDIQVKDTTIADEKTVYITATGTAYTSKAAAEEAMSGSEIPENPGDSEGSTTVWFYNSNGWTSVNAYVYGASNGEALGTWPGKAATRDGSTNWWSVEVPADPQFTIIFNDGAGAQSKDVSIADETKVYVTVSGTAPFATKEAAEESVASPEPASTTVWFYNSDGWVTVNAYVYGAAAADPMGAWPGATATQDGDSDWWSVEVPADPQFVIIFNNGSGAQSMDVTIDDKEQVYVTVTGSDAYADKESAEAAQKIMDEDRKGTVRVWFYNSEGWAYVHAYVYGSVQADPLGKWPGTRATRNGERWWYIDIDVDRPFYVIFNNGSSSQSPDTQITDSTNVYVTMNKDGAYASKQEAEASISSLKPIISTTTTVWFYNNLGWKNVCAYAWGTANGDPLGVWPGSQATRYEDTDWWYITCNFPAPFYIIFNDGVEGGAQTQGVHITDSWNVYTTYQANKKYASMEAAEASVGETTRVYFYNSNGWSEVYAYGWGGVQGENFGAWPGTLAKRESKDSYWYYVEILAGTQLNIIFNNGVDEQTNGVLIDDNENIYVTVNDEKFANKAEAEATIENVADILPVRANRAYTVWYYNSENWTDVYLYVENAEGEAFFGSEPGVKMHRLGNTGWFYMNVAAGLDFTVKFSDDAGKTTDVFTVSDKACTYFTADGQYTSKNEAMGLSVEPAEPPAQEEPEKNEPVKDEGSSLASAIAGGSVISLATIAGYALVLMKKRKKQTAN